VFATRELARGLSTYVKGTDPQTKFTKGNIARLVKAYTVALRLSLRKLESNQTAKHELDELLTYEEAAKLQGVKKNFVLIIAKWIGDEVATLKGQLEFDRAMDFLEKHISDMIEAWMGMHKLATTPMPFPYVQMMYTLLYLWMGTVGIVLSLTFG
jgi:predicted membrane chloride channel (bestrophin family)